VTYQSRAATCTISLTNMNQIQSKDFFGTRYVLMEITCSYMASQDQDFTR